MRKGESVIREKAGAKVVTKLEKSMLSWFVTKRGRMKDDLLSRIIRGVRIGASGEEGLDELI